MADSPVIEVFIPRTEHDLRAAIERLEEATVISCDIETSGLSPYSDKMLSLGIGALYDGSDGLAVIIPYEIVSDASENVISAVWDTIFRTTRRTVFQNGKFDIRFIARWAGARVPTEALLGDTLLLGFLLDERPRKDRMGSLGLKEQASYRYDVPDYHWDWAQFYLAIAHDQRDGSCGLGASAVEMGGKKVTCHHPHPDDVYRANWTGMYQYQAMDVYATLRMWHDLVAEAEHEPGIFDAHENVLMPAAKALAVCESTGAPLDFEWIARLEAWLMRRISRREEILKAVGVVLGAPGDINVGSPSQVADLMYGTWEMTPDMRRRSKNKSAMAGGADRSTDKEHIEAAIRKYVEKGNEVQRRGARWLRMLLRLRLDAKMLSTYVESLVDKADADGRVRASFLIHGTATGRLSSSNPNLQNIPAVSLVKGEYIERRSGKPTRWPARRAFAPPPGYLMAEADYGQLELRVAAALSGDKAFGDVFRQGRDIHLEVAATMFSKDPKDISKPERFLAKAVDFGILYGRTAKALANGAEMDFLESDLGGKRWDEATAQAFINKFLRGYPQLGRWIHDTAQAGLRDRYVASPFGRRRRFPVAPRTKWEKEQIERQAVNTPVQGTASDLCLLAMAKLVDALPDGAHVLFPVHDSLVLEFREDLLDDVRAMCKEIMEQDFLGVPMAIDFEYGPNWADIH